MINKNNKKGFTMFELIVVIVVMGILAAASLSQLKVNTREHAINNILSSLRYTQHLALADNKMDPNNPLWQRNLWTLKYKKCDGKYQYSIVSDSNSDGIYTDQESVISPVDGKLLFSKTGECDSNKYSDQIRLGDNLDISSIEFSGCNVGDRSISFDYLGRPHQNISNINISDYGTLVKNNCIITYTFNTSDINPIIVTINRETGFISVQNRARL